MQNAVFAILTDLLVTENPFYKIIYYIIYKTWRHN